MPIRSRWSERQVADLEGRDLLVYATRLIGADPDLVLWGGGNSSIKVRMPDHRGHETTVLWIKGSGSDMRTITPSHFTPLRLDDLLLLKTRSAMTDEEMVSYQSRSVLQPGSPNPSIETLLHAFIPAPHVYHTHADSICALTDVSDSALMIKRVYGEEVALIPYIRPGFTLAKLVGQALEHCPTLRAIILDKHGLVTWGESPREAYLQTIRMVRDAERFIRRAGRPRYVSVPSRYASVASHQRRDWAARIAVALRGALGQETRKILTYDSSREALQFVNWKHAKDLSQTGPFTPDHILHTKARPLFLEIPNSGSPRSIEQEVHKAVQNYRQAYIRSFEQYTSGKHTMHEPNPRVILIPGIGLFATGKDRRACRITHDLYLHTMRVILDASSIDTYTGLSNKDLFDFEYWPMETYKLTLLPPEKEMSRRIVLVTGAAGAIGREIARKFVAAGASVILTDINEEKLRDLSAELNAQAGEENTIAVPMDITDEGSVTHAFRESILAYGGLDVLVSNAGIARSNSVDTLSFADWNESFAVNATGHFLVCREAMHVFKHQGLGGNIAVVATKNVPAPGKDFGAYSASKAAQAQLARVLAIEGAEYGVRVNMVNPDGILEGSGIWSKSMRQGRAKAYGIPLKDLDAYCITRNLLKVKVTAQDVAEAVLFLASDRSAKTTGAMIPVDGGIKEAFPR